MAPTAGRAVVLEARGVSKVFSGTTALSGVDFAVERGRVHALIGENGAGKSTLVRILAGVDRPTTGRLLLDGGDVAFRSTREATVEGISLIHQELQLFPDLSVADNVFVGQERLGRWPALDRTGQERVARQTLARLGQQLDPQTIVGSLPVGVQQMVEIARTLVRHTRVLLMDEPTSALTASEVGALFGVIRDLAARGVAIVYISHRLQELLAIADSVTVLRDGRVVGSDAASAVDVPWIVERMTGRAPTIASSEGARPAGPTVLEVEGLSLSAVPGRSALHHVSLDVHAGDVIGVYGSMGAGRTELLESLFGIHGEATGRVVLHGKQIDAWPVHCRVEAGMAMIPEDRQRSGLVPTLSVQNNMTLSSLGQFTRAACISRPKEQRAAREFAESVGVKAPHLEAPIAALSGGNQQKVLIARALMSRPRVLLMDEPTRGVDVGARADIIRTIRQLAAEGMAIVFTSSDLDEIRAASTRVLVLCRGRVAAEFSAADADEAAIAGAASIDVHTDRPGESCPSHPVL